MIFTMQLFCNLSSKVTMKQGRIHGYRNRVRVGRGSDEKGLPKHLGRGSNAKTVRNSEKVNADQRTERPTDIAGYRAG